MAKIKLVVSATVEETFSDFIISRKTKGLAEKTLQSYQSQFQAVARHMDVKMDIAMLQKADLDAMIISMRDASLSPNSINSYTRTLKSFFSWCNEQGITRLNIPLYKAEETVKETYSDAELAALLTMSGILPWKRKALRVCPQPTSKQRSLTVSTMTAFSMLTFCRRRASK